MNIEDCIEKMPKNYYVCQKALWCGDIKVDIDHINNDIKQPLDYEKAFNKMISKLKNNVS